MSEQQERQPMDLECLHKYYRLVADANATWEGKRREIYARLQARVATAYANAANEYNHTCWQEWQDVHLATVKLWEAMAAGNNVAETYGAYCSARCTFDQQRWRDYLETQKVMWNEIMEANQSAQKDLQAGYETLISALEGSCSCRGSTVEGA